MTSSTSDAGRALFGISRAGMTIKQFGVLNRFHVPARAMTMDLFVNIALVLFIKSNLAILYMSNIGYVLAHIFALSGFLLLRKDRPNWPRPIKLGTGWVPVVAFLCVLNAFFLVVGALAPKLNGYGTWTDFIIGVGILVASLLLFVYRHKVQDRREHPLPGGRAAGAGREGAGGDELRADPDPDSDGRLERLTVTRRRPLIVARSRRATISPFATERWRECDVIATVPREFPQLRHPIVQAPMAGGPSTPELTIAVSNAGGLGFLAAGYRTAQQLRDDIAQTRGRGRGQSVRSEPVLRQPRSRSTIARSRLCTSDRTRGRAATGSRSANAHFDDDGLQPEAGRGARAAGADRLVHVRLSRRPRWSVSCRPTAAASG